MPPLDPTRRFRITASMIPILMNGDHDAIQNMYLGVLGDPAYQPGGFSETWTACVAQYLEPFVLDWHQQQTGLPITERGVQYFHPTRPFVSCTLDGWRASDNAVIDCKVTNGFRDYDDTVAYYTGQLICQMECKQADNAALVICRGGAEPVEMPVLIDEGYREAVWMAVDEFWHCVETFTPPVPLHFPRIVPPEKWRKLDLDHDRDLPNWSGEVRELLTAWDTTHEIALTHERIKTNIKSLIPDDVGEVLCSSFAIRRDRRNALAIRLRKSQP